MSGTYDEKRDLSENKSRGDVLLYREWIPNNQRSRVRSMHTYTETCMMNQIRGLGRKCDDTFNQKTAKRKYADETYVSLSHRIQAENCYAGSFIVASMVSYQRRVKAAKTHDVIGLTSAHL